MFGGSGAPSQFGAVFSPKKEEKKKEFLKLDIVACIASTAWSWR